MQQKDAESADAQLVTAVCALDDYLSAHQRVCGRLQQGFLKLAQARRHLPPHALSDLSFREHFDAVTVVTPVAPDDDECGGGGGDNDDTEDSNVSWRLTTPSSSSKWESEQQPSETSANAGLTQRRATGKTRQKEETPGGDKSDEQQQRRQLLERQSATLLWFSSLPPSDLRQAQKLFHSALQDLVVAATSAAKVQQW